MLVPPVFLLSFATAYFYQSFGVLTTYRWQRAMVDLAELGNFNFYQEIQAPPDLSEDEINRYLAGSLPDGHFLERICIRSNDPWDNSYRCVSSTNSEGKIRFEFYSVGVDGISNSGGNDEDDLNTWSDQHSWEHNWYREEIDRRKRIDSAITGSWIASIICICFLMFKRGRQKIGETGVGSLDVEESINGTDT